MNERSSIVCGSFELHEPVGRGGMATVWSGTHRDRGVPAAMKVLTEGHALDRDAREAFRREVRAQAGLDHPGIATVYEYGRLSTEADIASDGALTAGSPYFALEFTPAGSLREQADVDSWPLLQSLLLEVLDALSHAHARGVIHRDLKPENVLYFPGEANGRFKLTDFGIAHAIGGEVGADTETIDDAGAGTPHYMPPEQLQGEWRVFGPWTDLYALGCLAYEIVDGHVPFDDENLVEVATQQLTERPPEIDPEFPIPRGFRAWIRCLLAKDLRDRFRRAADAAWMLSRMPSAAGERRETAGAVAGQPARESGRSKAEFTGGWSHTRRMWSVSRSATDVEPECETETNLQFAASEPRLTTLAPQLSVDANVVGDATRNDDGASNPLETAFQSGPPPPLPESWNLELAERPSTAVVDAGLELFGLREVPFVGRRDARDTVWEQLDEVFESRRPRALEIVGPPGVGKTRLSRWTARRAHEVGAAHILWAPHSRRGGPTEGLPAMLESEFGIWGLNRKRAFRRISSEIQARYGRLQSSVRDLDDEARALTEIIAPMSGSAPDRDSPKYRFSSAEERYGAVARFLGELARERPVFVVFDDIQWGTDALQFVEYVLEHRPDLPVLFAMTGRREEIGDRPAAADVLDRLRETRAHRHLELEPLESAESAELAHRLLPLEMSTTQRLVEAADGRPLFAVQQLASWIDRDRIRVGSSGFELTDEVEGPADDAADIWDDRLDRAIASLQRDGASEIERSLELAAALGPHVDLEEWRTVCDRAGVDAPDAVYGVLIRMGLARSKTQGWSFVHRQLVDRAARRARLRGRWRDHHRVCAEGLSELYSADNARMLARVIEHYRDAGVPERAVGPMLAYARHLFERGAYHRLRRILDERSSLLENLEDSREARLDNLRLRARLAAEVEGPHPAGECATRLRHLARKYGADEANGWGHLLEARAFGDLDQPKTADRHLEHASEAFSAADSRKGLGLVDCERGDLARRRGEPNVAARFYRRAADVFEEADEPVRELGARIAAVTARLESGELESASSKLRNLAERARDLGSDRLRALVWRRLGELRRRQGDEEGAEAARRNADLLSSGAPAPAS